MRSQMIRKRALEQDPNREWPTDQNLEEIDLPGSKSRSPEKPGVGKDASEEKTADMMSDMVRRTVAWLRQHRKDPNVLQEVKNQMPLGARIPEQAIKEFVRTGNESALIENISPMARPWEGKQSVASAKSKLLTEDFQEPKRLKPAEKVVEESANNTDQPVETPSGRSRSVKLDQHESPESAPSAWAIDNTREVWRKTNNKKSSTPSARAIGNKRERPSKEEVTTEEQVNLKKKEGSRKNALLSSLTTMFAHAWINASPEEKKQMCHDLGKSYEEMDTLVHTWLQIDPASTLNSGPMGQTYASKRAALRSDPEIPILAALNETDAPLTMGGELLGDDGQGNQLWLFRSIDKVANRFEDEDGDVFWDDDIEGWNYTSEDALTYKLAAGGAEEEELQIDEPETGVDGTVVQLLEACKYEWSGLGEPVNPETWPKEIERAILALNDDLVAAIQKTEDKLVEGEFYSKNVDEGVEGHGGSKLNDLNIAQPENNSKLPLDNNESSPDDNEMVNMDEEVDKMSSKRASSGQAAKTAMVLPDVSSTETRKGLRHVQTLKDRIAAEFFEFKKNVQSANDSSLVKNIGETMVALKVKLEDVEKMLTKQLQVLEDAEKAIDEKKKSNDKKAAGSFRGVPYKDGERMEDALKREKQEKDEKDAKKEVAKKTAACPTCGAQVLQNGKDTQGIPCPTCAQKSAPNPEVSGKPLAQPSGAVPPPQAKPQSNVPQTGPVKHYGHRLSLSSLVLAGKE